MEWIDEPPARSEVPMQVEVPLLETDTSTTSASRRQAMVAALEKLAAANAFSSVDPIAWQRDIRQEQQLPLR